MDDTGARRPAMARALALAALGPMALGAFGSGAAALAGPSAGGSGAAAQERPTVVRANEVVVAPLVEDTPELGALLEEAAASRIVHLVGDSGGGRDAEEAFLRAQRTVIELLHERAGYDVLVFPVGLFEGTWLDEKLASGAPADEATLTLYRVWRESPAFMELVEWLRGAKTSGTLDVVGGLARYHAAAKALYAPHLSGLLGDAGNATMVADIDRVWGGTERLARATPELRREAEDLFGTVLQRFDAARSRLEAAHGPRRVALERRHIVNMGLFIELERIRSGDRDDDGFGRREKAEVLGWLLEHFAGRRLIYWEGRGESTEALPTSEPVFVVTLSPGNREQR